MAEDSIFTKIIKGEVPSYKIYEDDLTIAILPLHPIALAHVIVIPKLQVPYFYDLPDKDYEALMSTVKKVAKHLKDVINSKRVGLKVVGLDVDHTHVHVVAFDNIEQFNEEEDHDKPVDDQFQTELSKKLAM
jgi:histidine triad (HIT) family protein